MTSITMGGMRMALQADLLESIPQTRYLSAESYISYRAIMRTFYLEYQKMHYLHFHLLFAYSTSPLLWYKKICCYIINLTMKE